MNLHSLRQRLVDSPDSFGGRRRAARSLWLSETFPALSDMTVLDLGGFPQSWDRMPVRPQHVVVVNLEPVDESPRDWCEVVYGDACQLPGEVTSRTFDLVFSNSVLEHVGGHERRERFADSVHKMADRHWVQTPYRYFPIEPHWIAPGLQFVPIPLRASIAFRWPLSHTRPSDLSQSYEAVLWTELVGRGQFRHYFPTSTIREERLAGLTKSLIAFRT